MKCKLCYKEITEDQKVCFNRHTKSEVHSTCMHEALGGGRVNIPNMVWRKISSSTFEKGKK